MSVTVCFSGDDRILSSSVGGSLNLSPVQIQTIVFRRYSCPVALLSTDWLSTMVHFLLACCFFFNFKPDFYSLVTKPRHTMANTTTTIATTTIQCCNVVNLALVASAWIQEISRTDVSLPLIEQKRKKMDLLWTVTSCIVSDSVPNPLYYVLVMTIALWQAYSINIWEHLVDLYCVILW